MDADSDKLEQGLERGNSVCPRCGNSFTCGMKAGKAKCWCAELPHLPPPEPGAAGCYCPQCLRDSIAQRKDQR